MADCTLQLAGRALQGQMHGAGLLTHHHRRQAHDAGLQQALHFVGPGLGWAVGIGQVRLDPGDLPAKTVQRVSHQGLDMVGQQVAFIEVGCGVQQYLHAGSKRASGLAV